jgi:hypothetical protein
MDGFAKAPDPPAPSTLSSGWQLARTAPLLRTIIVAIAEPNISTAEKISDALAQSFALPRTVS